MEVRIEVRVLQRRQFSLIPDRITSALLRRTAPLPIRGGIQRIQPLSVRCTSQPTIRLRISIGAGSSR